METINRPQNGTVTARLRLMPRIDVMQLSRVTSVPAFHPEHDGFTPFPVFGFLVHHPDGPFIVDTGIGHGHTLIDSLYGHESIRLIDELHRLGVDERDVRFIANSHLHFDHCGQNGDLDCQIAVQAAEISVAAEPHYTVAEWAAIPDERAWILDGDDDLATGVRALWTPGHTPGHQSIVMTADDAVVVVAAQCLYRRTAWDTAPETGNLHDQSWLDAAADSLNRLRSLDPTRVLLSHDAPIELVP